MWPASTLLHSQILKKSPALTSVSLPAKSHGSSEKFCFSPLLDAAVLEDSSIQRKNHVFSFLLAFSDGIRYDGETGTS